jgi:hypothetical protein
LQQAAETLVKYFENASRFKPMNTSNFSVLTLEITEEKDGSNSHYEIKQLQV